MDNMRQICMDIFGTDNPEQLKKIAEKAMHYDRMLSGLHPKNVRGAGRKSRFSEADINKMRELYRGGMTVAEIAVSFQTTRQTVYKYLDSEMRLKKNSDIAMRIYYMHGDTLCTIIDVDFKHKKVYITNKTDHILLRAFGVLTQPTWEEYENFLESRCFPRTRDHLKDILRDLGLDAYDPLRIVEKTEGRMAEDYHWMKFEYKEELQG